MTLLPYNHLWEAKLGHLDTAQAALGIRTPPAGYYAEVERRFAQHGITARLSE